MKSLKIPNGACICQYVDFGTREILIVYGDSIIYNDEMIKRKLLSLYQKGHQKVRHKPPSRWSCFIPY
jgi:hypothetical protein